jgi:hypothetical protein
VSKTNETLEECVLDEADLKEVNGGLGAPAAGSIRELDFSEFVLGGSRPRRVMLDEALVNNPLKVR